MKYNNYIFIVVATSLLAMSEASIPSGGDLMDKVYSKCKSNTDCKTAQGFSCCVVTKEGDASQGTYCLKPTKERTKGQYVTNLPDGKSVNQYFVCNPNSVLSTPINGDSKKDSSGDKVKSETKPAANAAETQKKEPVAVNDAEKKQPIAAVTAKKSETDQAAQIAEAAKKAAQVEALKKAQADAAAKVAADAVKKSNEANQQAFEASVKAAEADAATKMAADAIKKSNEAKQEAYEAAMKAANANLVNQKSKLDVLQQAQSDAAVNHQKAKVYAETMQEAANASNKKLEKVSLNALVTNSKVKVAQFNVVKATEAKKEFEIKREKLKLEMEQSVKAAKEADQVALAASKVSDAKTKDNNVVQARFKEAQDSTIVEEAKKTKFDTDVKEAQAVANKADEVAKKLDKEKAEWTKQLNAAVKTSQEKKASQDKANAAVAKNLKDIQDSTVDNNNKDAANQTAQKAYQTAIQATKDKVALKKTADSNVAKQNQVVASATDVTKAKQQVKLQANTTYLANKVATIKAQSAKDKADKAVTTADTAVTDAGDDVTDDEKAALKKAKDEALTAQKALNQAQTDEKQSKTALDTATKADTDAIQKLTDAKNTQATVVKAANAADTALKNAQTDESSKQKVAEQASKAYKASKLNLAKLKSEKPQLEQTAKLAVTAYNDAIKKQSELKAELDKCTTLCDAADIKLAAANKDLAKKQEIASAQDKVVLAAKKKEDSLNGTATNTAKLALDAAVKYRVARLANVTASSKSKLSIAAYESCMKDCAQKAVELVNAQKAATDAVKQNELAHQEVVKCAADFQKVEQDAKAAMEAAQLAEQVHKDVVKLLLKQKGVYDDAVLEAEALKQTKKVNEAAKEEIKQKLKEKQAKEIAAAMANKTAAKNETKGDSKTDKNNQTVTTVTNTSELIKEAEEALKNMTVANISVIDQINLAPQGENASFNIKWGNDEIMVDSKTFKNGTQSLSQILKFDKYFMHSFDTNQQKPGDPTPQCSNTKDCNQNIDQVCCANAVMTDQTLGKQMSVYRCMNKDVVNANFDLDIDGFAVSMRCVGADASSAFTMAVNGFLATISIIAFLTF